MLLHRVVSLISFMAFAFVGAVAVAAPAHQPAPSAVSAPQVASTANPFQCDAALVNATKEAVTLESGDTFTINLTGSGCAYLRGPALLNSILEIKDQNNNVISGQTSLAGVTSLTVRALYATPTNTYLRFSSQVTSTDNAAENAVFTFRTLSGGADILRVQLSSTGLLGSGTLLYDGDYTREDTSYDHTATTITATVSASSDSPTWGVFSSLTVNDGTTTRTFTPTGPSLTFPITLTNGHNDFTLTMVSEDGNTSRAHPMRITRYTTVTASSHEVAQGGAAPTVTYTTQPSPITFTTPPTCSTTYDQSGTYADWATLPTACIGGAATGHVFRYVNGTVTVAGPAVGPDAPTGVTITNSSGTQTLSWTAPTTSITGSLTDYIVEYSMVRTSPVAELGYWYPIDDPVSTATSIDLTGFGTTSTKFRVRAVDADGPGAPSSSVFSTDSSQRYVAYTTPGTRTVATAGGYINYNFAIVGGGGGGGAGAGFGGGGGGGGYVSTGSFSSTSSSSAAVVQVAVGAGGTGGVGSTSPTVGQDTTVTGAVTRTGYGGGAGGHNAAAANGQCVLVQPSQTISVGQWGGGGGGDTSCTTADPGPSTLGSPFGSVNIDQRAGGGGFGDDLAGGDASSGTGGNGGRGTESYHTGSSTRLGGGGGGGTATAIGTAGSGGSGGGGAGGAGTDGVDGQDGFGGGGGGGGGLSSSGGDGGDGAAYFWWNPRTTEIGGGWSDGSTFFNSGATLADTSPEFRIFAETSYAEAPTSVRFLLHDGDQVISRTGSCADENPSDGDWSNQRCSIDSAIPPGTWVVMVEVSFPGVGGHTVTRVGSRGQFFPFIVTIPASSDPMPATLPTVTDPSVNVYYSESVAVTGGVAPITYAITSGSLPTGLALDTATGVISGTPTSGGSASTFTIRATDAVGAQVSRAFTVIPTPTVQTGFSAITSSAEGAPGEEVSVTPVWALSSGAITYSAGSSTACTVDVFGTVTMTHTNGDTSGTCTITISSAADSTYQAATASVTIPVTSTADVKGSTHTVTEGDPVPTLTHSALLTGSTTPAPITFATAPTCSTTYTPSSGPGSYPVTCTTGSATGWRLTAVAGSITVNAATTTTTSTTTTTTTTSVPSGSSGSTTTVPGSTTTGTTVPGSSSGSTGASTDTTAPSTAGVTTTTVLTQTVVTVAPNEPTPVTDPAWPTPPGQGRIIVDGRQVEVDVFVVDRSISETPPEQRTEQQIATIRQVGEQMLEAARQAAGGDGTIPVSIRYTDTGAVFLGLVIDPVTGASIEIPVEDVALLIGGGLVIMVGGISADGDPSGIEFDGVLQLGQGGWIAVLGFGLEPQAPGEVIVMSTPRLLGRFRTDDAGGAAVQARIPNDLEVGEHTAVVSAGGDSASIGFRVVGGTSGASLPSTGSESDGALPWVVLLLAVGGLAVLVDRRRLVV